MHSFTPSLLDIDSAGSYSRGWMPVREEPSSYDYLTFAKLDRSDGLNPRNLVNAVGNAKRAIHLRLEDLCLGFGAVNLKKLQTHPKLLDYVRRCGIVAPDLLKRLNDERNDIEHRFAIPTVAEVDTHIDVAELFLDATDRWRDSQPCEVEYFQTLEIDSESFCIVGLLFDWKEGVARIRYRLTAEKNRWKYKSIDYHAPSEEYFECVRFLLASN